VKRLQGRRREAPALLTSERRNSDFHVFSSEIHDQYQGWRVALALDEAPGRTATTLFWEAGESLAG